jgi:hypothetical protein
MDSRTKKDDKKNQLYYESSGIGGRINRYIKFGPNENNELDENVREKNFIKDLAIPKSTYYEIKKRIIKESLLDKESKSKIYKF